MRNEVAAIAREAGELAAAHFARLPSLRVEEKGPLDLVSEADRDVERLIARRLAESFPDDGLLGEEGASRPSRSGRTWVIDPIDGTFNFLRGGANWAVSIGLHEDGRPSFGAVFAPRRDQFLIGGPGAGAMINGAPLPRRPAFEASVAVVGVGLHPAIPVDDQMAALRFIAETAGIASRNTGSAVSDLIDVATGLVDGYLGLGISSWDLMGVLPILEEVGIGTTLDWDSVDLGGKLNLVCGPQPLLELLDPLLGSLSC